MTHFIIKRLIKAYTTERTADRTTHAHRSPGTPEGLLNRTCSDH
jgi:hypothetical protein